MVEQRGERERERKSERRGKIKCQVLVSMVVESKEGFGQDEDEVSDLQTT